MSDCYLDVAFDKMSKGVVSIGGEKKQGESMFDKQRVQTWLSLGRKQLTRQNAEQVLLGEPPGSFIFRRGSQLGTYAITVRTADGFKNFQILCDEKSSAENNQLYIQDGLFPNGTKQFNSVHELLSDGDVRRIWNLVKPCTAYDKKVNLHSQCRGEKYADKVARVFVPDGRVSWEEPFPGYKPTNYTSSSVLTAPLSRADPDDLLACDPATRPKWNKMDGKVDRMSLEGRYEVIDDIIPLNPNGRTGVSGRGMLFRWAVNHYCHPILTRWLRDESGAMVMQNGAPVLQFVSINYGATKEPSIPGGLKGVGEVLPLVLLRDFSADTIMSKGYHDAKRLAQKIESLLHPKNGQIVYQGYLDDEFNTDNAWIETTVVNFHDDDGFGFQQIGLHPESKGEQPMWKTLDGSYEVWGYHATWMKHVIDARNAYVPDDRMYLHVNLD